MTERQMVQIPKESEVFKYLFEGTNHRNMAKWEILEEVIKQLPQSKQDRAYRLFCSFKEELEILYPESKKGLELLWPLIAKRILKIRDIEGKEQFLDDFVYSELREL